MIRLRVRYMLLTAVFAAVVVLHPGLARAAGVDFWNLTDARAELATEVQHSETLTDRDDAILRRIIVKEDLIGQLLAGQTDLAAVTHQFLELSADEPSYLSVLRTSAPEDSDLELAARNVIDYATARASAAERAAVLDRLEAELSRMQDADLPAAR
ncbi:hypothetical protein [Urbifossiella limnaea]|uniref:Uncharacterized protein n=1 Tax=Urbifossiella limnaea TaxID=2528023 RepID=A0A517XPG4_9BACT|nr:hypothetical protein [Urbifossiella limnaea]QDU19384.1 hypothetical protein ETAA1_13080 [Urbifossiella limnaea]